MVTTTKTKYYIKSLQSTTEAMTLLSRPQLPSCTRPGATAHFVMAFLFSDICSVKSRGP